MGVNYKIIKGDIFKIEPNVHNHKIAFLVKGNDDKTYFVKPSWVGFHNNLNEYLAHHIGSLIDAPLLDGCFIKINADSMMKWHKTVESFHETFLHPTFIPPYKEAIFFGVEFKRDLNTFNSILEVKATLNIIHNKDEFYSHYALDQYLKNLDRHVGNLAIHKEPRKLVFYLFDFDRLFLSTWNTGVMKKNFDNFDCFSSESHNEQLYQLVDRTAIKTAQGYGAKISYITDDDISEIINTISIIYNISKDELDTLSKWIRHRKEKIYDACLKNEICFPNIVQRGLSSVNR